MIIQMFIPIEIDTKKIPPRNEWKELSVAQLIDVKNQMMDVYYAMRQSKATFANQYQIFINEIDALIARRDAERLAAEAAEKEDQG